MWIENCFSLKLASAKLSSLSWIRSRAGVGVWGEAELGGFHADLGSVGKCRHLVTLGCRTGAWSLTSGSSALGKVKPKRASVKLNFMKMPFVVST